MSPGPALPTDPEVSQEAFLESDPPHWAARGLTYILISLFVVVLLISVIVEVPETVSAPFVLVPEGGTHAGEAARDGGDGLHAEVIVPQSALAVVSPGQSVKMLYDAFPYQRYGARYGTVRSATPVSVAGDDRSEFVVIADPAERTVVVNGQSRPLLAGMRGTARIMVGSRSLIGHAFEPLRMLRETVAKPPTVPGPSAVSDRHDAG